MNVKKDKGSIAIFVLVALLFMSAFLIISFASNVNKSKTVKEQFNIISGIYAYANGEEGAYDKAYSDLRNKNKQTMTASSENSSTLELTKTFDENMSNYRIYGNSVQNGTPTPDNPVEVQSVGDLVTDTTDANYGKYKIPIDMSGKNLFNTSKITTSGRGIENYSGDIEEFKNIPCYHFIDNSKNFELSLDFKESTQYTLTIKYYRTESNKDKVTYINFHYSDGSIDYCTAYNNTTYTFTSFPGKTLTKVTGNYNWGTSAWIDLTATQLEEGAIATEYEPYVAITTNIYIDEPLRKVGDYADYIDFKTGKVVRYVGKIDSYNGETITTSWISSTGELSNGATVYYALETPIEENITLPQLKSFEDYTKIEVLTSVAPSKIEVEYMGYTLE